ncbi:preprotein translocase subunit SecG [Stella sp.]|uniref:preprotein translocase subunit SecG n=1 Tax=Stella sp. TaxID=2912054 RepID=UPI0035B4E6A8
MAQVILVIHLLIAVALVVVILLQRSEGGALGIGGGGSGGMAGFLSGRGQANLLTRTTAILAACFVVTSLTLVHLTGGAVKPRSIVDQPPATPAAPAAPAAPAVPQAN